MCHLTCGGHVSISQKSDTNCIIFGQWINKCRLIFFRFSSTDAWYDTLWHVLFLLAQSFYLVGVSNIRNVMNRSQKLLYLHMRKWESGSRLYMRIDTSLAIFCKPFYRTPMLCWITKYHTLCHFSIERT